MTSAPLRVPRAMRDRADAIMAVTDGVCAAHLDDEYAALARRLVARLARKRPSPLARGDIRIWAAGTVYALGRLNFLFDRSQTPHMTAGELAAAFGVVKTTMANKAGQIDRLLGLHPFDSDLTRVALLEQPPLALLVDVAGLILDAGARRPALVPYPPPMRSA